MGGTSGGRTALPLRLTKRNIDRILARSSNGTPHGHKPSEGGVSRISEEKQISFSRISEESQQSFGDSSFGSRQHGDMRATVSLLRRQNRQLRDQLLEAQRQLREARGETIPNRTTEGTC